VHVTSLEPTGSPSTRPSVPATVDEVVARLDEHAYLCDRRLATAILVALRIGKPLFVEGEAGVGKTELARAMAAVLGARLIRLQCYEGIDLAHAAYEWNYARQLLHIRLLDVGRQGDVEDTSAAGRARAERDLFSDDYLLRRPLLDAIDNHDPVAPVLLIDEIDRSDEEFEAFLLELLADYAISIPELGTVRAERPPFVVLTGNRTREVHDALKRRCLYHWIDYPELEREVAIVRARAPEVTELLARQVARLVHRLREMDLYKLPGVAETVDWARALAAVDGDGSDPQAVAATLGAAVKYQEDLEAVRQAIPDLLPGSPA
jgi:MoxR-like ATPase